ncbi:MAG TPA: FkbM family methyltransferase [Polyangiaceae bacterium]|nr:FkbM family methyltransferase [Polyangiaceae bacterium]
MLNLLRRVRRRTRRILRAAFAPEVPVAPKACPAPKPAEKRSTVAKAAPAAPKPKRRFAYPDMRQLCQHVREPIIFDVGAHHGKVSLRFRSFFPHATIFAFEPFAESFRTLEQNTRGDARIQAFQLGLSRERGLLEFHSNANSNTNSLLASSERGLELWGEGLFETQEVIRAQFTTLDEFVAEHGIPRIDILKMDVQGAEHWVLEGAAETLAAGKVGLVYCEMSTQPSYHGQKRFDRALADYYDRGFDLHNFYNESSTDDGVLRQLDAIFVPAGR